MFSARAALKKNCEDQKAKTPLDAERRLSFAASLAIMPSP
jgi:hypothetical protein